MYGARRVLETALGLISSVVFSATNHSPQDICEPHKFLDILSSNILNLTKTIVIIQRSEKQHLESIQRVSVKPLACYSRVLLTYLYIIDLISHK